MEQGVASEDVLSHLPSPTDGLRRRSVRSSPRAARSSSWRPSGPSSRTPSGSPAPLVPELAAAPRAASRKPSLPDLTVIFSTALLVAQVLPSVAGDGTRVVLAARSGIGVATAVQMTLMTKLPTRARDALLRRVFGQP